MSGSVGKICKAPGCPQFSFVGHGYCQSHAGLAPEKFSGGLSKLQMYKTRRWQALRLSMLRKFPVCSRCKVKQANVVHHIQEARKFPQLAWEPSNLETLCSSCHNSESAREGLKTRKIRNYHDEI
jgi:5-methylcytosine-specific restriction enzyme A